MSVEREAYAELKAIYHKSKKRGKRTPDIYKQEKVLSKLVEEAQSYVPPELFPRRAIYPWKICLPLSIIYWSFDNRLNSFCNLQALSNANEDEEEANFWIYEANEWDGKIHWMERKIDELINDMDEPPPPDR